MFGYRLSAVSSVLWGLFRGSLLLSSAGLIPWSVSRQGMDSRMHVLAFSEWVSGISLCLSLHRARVFWISHISVNTWCCNLLHLCVGLGREESVYEDRDTVGVQSRKLLCKPFCSRGIFTCPVSAEVQRTLVWHERPGTSYYSIRSGHFEIEHGIWGLSHLHRHSWWPVLQTVPVMLSLTMGFHLGQEARRLFETSVWERWKKVSNSLFKE